MNILNPVALLAGLLAIPIILLYLLRLQRREQSVSSTMLWQQVILDREANTLWQKLRRNLLLLLQLLTLAALVLALIRPYINMPSTLSGRLMVLLDGSASMLATDSPPSRFEDARSAVGKLIDELGPNNEMSIILVDGSPHAIASATTNKSDLHAALDHAQPSPSPSNWNAAIALASASSGGTGADGASTTVVVSDGANAEDLQQLAGNVRFLPIGVNGDNLAISNLSIRKTTRGLAAFIRVTNLGSQDDKVLVSVRSDHTLLDARTLNIPAGQSENWTINGIDPQISWVRGSIDEAGHNTLLIDDVAYVVNGISNIRHVLLLSPGNRFLEQALAVLPNLQVTRAITPSAQPDGKPYDLYVLDGVSMTLPVRANAMVIGNQSFFTTSGTFSNTAFARSEQHPVLDSVDWRSINASEVRRVNAPAWLKPLVESTSGPVLFAGEMPGESAPLGRVVLLPFALRSSDLPLQVAFPILIANSVDWLAPPQGLNIAASIKPGEVVALPRNTIVTLPDGNRVAVDQRGFAQTDQSGVYHASYKELNTPFAVGFSSPAESQITPHPDLQIGGSTPSSEVVPQSSQREIWGWLAVVALLLLITEWWIYQRGVPALQRKKF